MKSFWSYITNGQYSVGCTGQTVYLYDHAGNELKKFKDIIYAYLPMFSPNGTLFVVKSTDGRLAVYSLKTLSLFKKFRYSRVACAQDDGCCFSPDGKFFINLERQQDDLRSAISVYDTTDFSLVRQILFGRELMLNHIEFDTITGAYYVLGFMRDEAGIMDHGFVATLEDLALANITPITENEYDFYCAYKDLELHGFSTKSCEWSTLDYPLDKLKSLNHSLAKLYTYYHK